MQRRSGNLSQQWFTRKAILGLPDSRLVPSGTAAGATRIAWFAVPDGTNLEAQTCEPSMSQEMSGNLPAPVTKPPSFPLPHSKAYPQQKGSSDMTLVWVISIMTVAIIGQSTFGFGAGLISIPILSLLIGVKDGVTLALMLQTMTGLLAFRVYKDTRWDVVIPMMLGLLPATLVGIGILSYVPERPLKIFLSVFIVLFLLKSTFWPKITLPGIERTFWALLSGVLSGLIQGTIGCGGPPLVIYLDQVSSKNEFRAGILTLLFSANVLRLIMSGPAGLLHGHILWTFLYASPFLVAGMAFGDKLASVISEGVYRRTIQIILVVSVISLLR